MTDKEKQIVGIKECIDEWYGCDCAYYGVDGFAIADLVYNAGFRKQTEEILNAIDSFKNALMNKFLMLCNYNDYSRLNLLKIDETVNAVFDEQIERILKGGESE